METIYMVGGILTLTFLMLGSVFLFLGLSRSRRTKKWNRTSGIVIKKEKNIHITLGKIFNKESLLSNGPDASPTFQYQVNGNEYEKTSSIQQKPGFNPGTIVDVLYDPNDPKQAIIDSFVQRGSIFTLLGWIFISIGFVILCIITLFILFS